MRDHISIPDRFESLKDGLEKVKSLLAWKDLHEEEIRTNGRPASIIYDPVYNDLRSEYALLIGTLDELQFLLNSDHAVAMSDSDRENWISQLKRAERNIRALNLPKHI